VDETGLLLRASGTTARPKGVPLLQYSLSSLINNGKITACSTGLQLTDAWHSVTPLFHLRLVELFIVMAPFNPELMVDALA